MGQVKANGGKVSRWALSAAAIALVLCAFASSAQAAPFHTRNKALDITGLNHACGAATDSKGDLYASSAGESKVKVFSPAHTLLTSIPDANTPCGLAVTTTGVLYVSEQATGEVVQFKPSEYPPTGATTYAKTTIDASGKAKGIAVDPYDDALYVAEGDHVSVYVHEMQTLQLENEVTGGSFTLEFKGQKTGPIPYNASGAVVQKALEELTTIGAGNVEVAEHPSSSSWAVFFTGKFAYEDVAGIGRDYSLLTGTNPRLGDIETAKGFSGTLGEGALTEATGVAAYTYRLPGAEKTYRYLWAADANGLLPDRLELLAGQSVTALKPRRELTGSTTPSGSFGFGTKGANIAADPGNRDAKGKCVVVGAQACTAGHLFLYDAEHKALDEFDATGEYLDQTANAAFADAEPTGVAIDRSGTANDGTIYVTAGQGAGAKALAFAPLKAPSRAVLSEPLSHVLAAATSVAVDSQGYVYVAQASLIHIYKPSGAEIKTEANKVLLEDKKAGKGAKPFDLAVDSTGKVYVLDENGGAAGEEEVTYYTPSKYPPVGGATPTTYTRHEPAVVTPAKFPASDNLIQAIAINPGPSSGKDRLFVTTRPETQEYASAAAGSGQLNKEFAAGLNLGNRQSLTVNGASGNVWFGGNPPPNLASEVDPSGKEILSQLENTGAANGKAGANPFVAVDQSNGHVVTFDGNTSSAREYDAAGSFVAQFGGFTEEQSKPYRVAVDNSCAIQGLTGSACEAFDPANGTAYVVFDDPSPSHPPYDVNAFGTLDYGTAPPPTEYELKVKKEGTGSGTLTSSPAGIDCGSTCSAKFEEDTEVTLSQAADSGSEFIGWGGACSGTGACKVSMSEAREVTAEFESTETLKFPLKVVIEGLGSGKVTSSPVGIECPTTCEAPFFKNTNVTLTAAEGESSKLAGWTGCDANPSATKCEVSITGPGTREVKVQFNVETPLLSVVKKGTGSGTVSGGSPTEPSTIACGAGSGCEHEFELNAEVTLKAKEAEGSIFSGWEVAGSPGACPGTGTCTVTMSEAKEVSATFTALPRALAKQAVPIGYTEATLQGEVDPAGLLSKYHFEYLSEAEYQANGETFAGARKTPVGELAASKGLGAVKASITGLAEGAEYRFRLLAENAAGSDADEGAFQTLRRRTLETCPNGEYRFGLSANLPDCRAYELVTPAQTNGLSPYATGEGLSSLRSFSNWLTPQSGEAAGERLSYFTDGTLPGFEGNGLIDGYRAERGAGEHPAGGWQSTIFSPSYRQADGSPVSKLGVASDQLYSILELRSSSLTFPETLPRGLYLSTPTGFEALDSEPKTARSAYASAGGTHAIFSSRAHLEPAAPPAPIQAVYDHPAGAASATVVSTPPPGASPALEAEFESHDAEYLGASEDGDAVVFTEGSPGKRAPYLHREGQTSPIAPGGAFAGISEDGRYVFFATGDGELPGPLFRFDTQSEEATEIAKAGIFALVPPDGEHAFFSSIEALTGVEENENGEVAEAGSRNLYAWDGTSVRFVARLATADFKEGAGMNVTGGFGGNHELNLAAWTRAIGLGLNSGRAYAPTRSTQSGNTFVFQSHARLTAYDNEGKGEIYRYDPFAPKGERLLCVSCDPSGAPPSADALLEDLRISSGSPVNSRTMIANLSTDGQRVFFQSFDRLLPEDANEAEDVYEWKAGGSGTCHRPAGCLALISSGQGEGPSTLYAMSADGNDVFFATQEKLVGADVTGSPSIYDARVGGGIPEPAPREPCQGDACQGQGALPPVLPNPASTGGGEAPETPAAQSCRKGKHRVKGRCVAAKHHKGKKGHRRAKHNRRAGK